MQGELIINIFSPKNAAEWIIVETDKRFFSLRLGGFKIESHIENYAMYDLLAIPIQNKRIEQIYTDDEWVYIVLEGGGIIASGWVEMNLLGEMKLGIKFSSIEEYGVHFFDSTIFSKLSIDHNGWSVKENRTV